jgi:hypothetical protein
MDGRKQLTIINGPNKPALLYSLVYPGRRHHVHFETSDDAFDASIDEMNELDDGFSFVLKGELTSGLHKHEPFEAIYNVGSRRGELGLVSRSR